MKSSMSFTQLIKLIEPGDSMEFFVLPMVNTKKKDLVTGTSFDEYTNRILLAYFTNGHARLVELEKDEIEDTKPVVAGRKLIIYSTEEETFERKRETIWKKAITYGTKEKANFCFGQNILVSAAPGGGKTGTCIELADAFDATGNSVSYRMLVGERPEDRLYKYGQVDKTINCDSTAPIHFQMQTFYETIARALKDAYDGKNAVLVIDSLSRLILSLTGLHSDSHMVSGGISFDVTVMASNLMKMGGTYGDGTLTVIGTCFFSPSHNTWKQIYYELSAAANAEVKVSRDPFNTKNKLMKPFSRMKEIKFIPYVDLFGIRFEY
jgi:transcription termination factor Rho